MRISIALMIASLTIVALGNPSARAAGDSYPTHPVRMVVTYPAGGGADITARIIAQKLTERSGQQFIVDNRPGGSGTIGAGLVAKAPPDGYTLMLDALSFSVNPSLFARLPYNPVADFTPIILAVVVPNVLVVTPSLPVNSVGELIALARAKPGQINHASSGNGSAQHLAAEMFKRMAGIDMVHVPYRGGAPALADLVAGQISVYFANLSSATPLIQAGKIRAIAVTSAERAPGWPALPTIAESGLPGYEAYEWNGIFAPGGTPRDLVSQLNHEITEILKLADVRERLAEHGLETRDNTPEQFTSFLASERAKWAQVVKEANIKID